MMVNVDVAERRYAKLVDQLAGEPGVTFETGTGFGSEALKVNGRIFAMLVRGNLVVKLPAKRVSELIASGDGTAFDANKGKPMKEWLVLETESRLDWQSLALEARGFVAAVRGKSR